MYICIHVCIYTQICAYTHTESIPALGSIHIHTHTFDFLVALDLQVDNDARIIQIKNYYILFNLCLGSRTGFAHRL